jgi:hypothetical protein
VNGPQTGTTCKMRARATIALLIAVALAGCSGGPAKDRSSEAEKAKAAKAAELEKKRKPAGRSPKENAAWLVRLREWRIGLMRAGVRAGRAAEAIEAGKARPRRLSRRLRPLTDCPRKLREKVGEPGAPRYRRGYELYTEACESISRWALDLQEAASQPDPDLAGLKAREEEVASRFVDAASSLEAMLLVFKQLPTAAGPAPGSRIEPRLGRAVNRLLYETATAMSIEVRCWSKRDWPKVKQEFRAYAGIGDLAGFAYDSNGQISIAPAFCAQLMKLVYRGERPEAGLALGMTAASVGLLAHEGGHLRESDVSEAYTECFAVQNVRELARILGTSASYADLLARVYWEYIYPNEPAEYRTGACRNGGPLDLNPRSDVWP